jgi:UDP:flavonoid glycosyltransferase YjiC (YdhE family)
LEFRCWSSRHGAWSDQFGNAARVSFHNLGIFANILDVTPEMMIEMVERVLHDKKIRSSVDEMKKQCNVQREIQEFIHFVKNHTALEL